MTVSKEADFHLQTVMQKIKRKEKRQLRRYRLNFWPGTNLVELEAFF